jgi:ubiquinone/menaquinone biosynthesis C-methylase UbiE
MDPKAIVRKKYTEIAETADSCCTGSGCCSPADTTDNFSDDYHQLEGYVPGADLQLGCGVPTQHAAIKTGDTVVDLGSGAGNDVFVARAITGETGYVIGIDMTKKMIQKARENVAKLGYKNVEFKLGDIENLPLADNGADVVLSNCVLNLVPDKQKAFNEIYRILKPGGHFCISDIVSSITLPASLQQIAELYTGCISGALKIEKYLDLIKNSGFKTVEIKTQKPIPLPEKILQEHFNAENTDLSNLMLSITVVGTK